MKHKRYIILFICIIIIGSYLFLKDKKNNTSPASTSTETSSTGEEDSKAGKAENPASNPASSNNTASEDEVKPKKADITMIDIVPNKVGNTSGNLQNGGFAAQQEKWMFYTLQDMNHSLPLYRAMLDGETGLKILQENSQMTSINVVGEWIYYLNPIEHRIYKIRTDGTDKTLLLTANTTSMVVAGESIYYAIDNEGISKVDTDGKNKQVVTSDKVVGGISIVSDIIYYSRINESSQHLETCKINTDGSNKKLISKDQLGNMIIQGDWIYYLNFNDNSKLYKIRLDGTNKIKLLDFPIELFNVSDSAIYYTPFVFPQSLYAAKIDGSKVTRLTEDSNNYSKLDGGNRITIININIIGDNIFCYCATSNGFNFLRVSSDGSIVKLLY